MNWYLMVLKKYAVFSGRASRMEYWMFTLISFIVIVVLMAAEVAVGGPGVLAMIYVLAVLVPSIAAAVRRLHDTGRSGWWILISFVPAIGGIILVILLVLASKPGDNEYGPNPLGAAA